MDLDVLSTPGHLISLAARGFARLSEARLKPLGFGVGHLPVLVALQDGRASTQRDLARFARIEQPPMAQMLARMERDGLIRRTPDPADGRMSRITLTEAAKARLPERSPSYSGVIRRCCATSPTRRPGCSSPAHAADRKPRSGRERRSVGPARQFLERGLTGPPDAGSEPEEAAAIPPASGGFRRD